MLLSDSNSLAIGFVAAGIAVVFFGSNFLPVKKFETGDGLFFQWIMCAGVWITGFILNLARGSPPFQPLAVVGGVLWATGNVMSVPIIRLIGFSLGLLLWGGVNMIAGWFFANFGIGIDSQAVHGALALSLNYIGVAIALIGMVPMAFIQTNLSQPEINDQIPLNNIDVSDGLQSEAPEKDIIEKLSPLQRKLFGIGASIFAGILYGSNFIPVQALIDDSDPNNPIKAIDCVFSHFCGILLSSTFWFLLYCAIKKNEPKVFPKAALPGFASGVLWAIAQISLFIANENLDIVIAYPIVCTGPGLVAALWGVLLFKEIQGKRNLSLLIGSFSLTVIGVVLITLSKFYSDPQ
eukprot:TRINITY_DN824_c0_g1_i2.p1 TRINITY_DN824_c0_g1~~TRINITY_DN824_c0_g1_i2.p1  ORF type:complete len:364 (+),score=164.25 TRINITY_DN824_c0_g1_i2:43-1092(+)